MTAILQVPNPTTKKQVREFWEMLDIAVFEYVKIVNTLHAAMARVQHLFGMDGRI